MVEADIIHWLYMSPVTLTLKIAKKSFRTPAHGDASTYLVQDIIHMRIHQNFEHLLLPWPWKQQAFHKTLVFENMVAQGSAVQKNSRNSHKLTESFHMTLQLLRIHHHTKLGYKRLSGSSDYHPDKTWTHGWTHRHSDSNIPPITSFWGV